jgi:hypothetical protein
VATTSSREELHTTATARYYTVAVTGMGTLSSRRILVVEDEALIALDLQNFSTNAVLLS